MTRIGVGGAHIAVDAAADFRAKVVSRRTCDPNEEEEIGAQADHGAVAAGSAGIVEADAAARARAPAR